MPDATAEVAISDQDYLLSLFDDGLVPIQVSHDAAVPDFAYYDEVVYEHREQT